MRISTVIFSYICFCCLSCFHNRVESFKRLGSTLEGNYYHNQKEFKVTKQILGSKYLTQIVLQSDESFSVSYVIKDESGRENWHAIPTFKPGTKATDDYLRLQDLSAQEVLKIASAIRNINCIRLIKKNLFDRYKGTENKCIDLQYEEKFEGDQVLYRLFDKNKDSLSLLFSDELIAADRGEIIDSSTLWYIK